MPRSQNQNWASQRRLEYISDHLHDHGWVNREALCAYFATERSLGSLDITAYQKAGNALTKAKAGDVMLDGTVARGYKLGGRLLYVGEGEDNPARREAWPLLPQGAMDHADWLMKIMSAYVADCGRDGAAEYFRIGPKEAAGIVAGKQDDRRVGIWEVWG